MISLSQLMTRERLASQSSSTSPGNELASPSQTYLFSGNN
jgi:hypothetical protein